MKKPVSTVRKVALMGPDGVAAKKQQPAQQADSNALRATRNDVSSLATSAETCLWASICKKSFFWIVAIGIATLLFLPKPQLIYYLVRGKEERSVYWPGFDNGAFEGRLLDADYAAAVNEETKTLYICNRVAGGRMVDHCSKYPISKTKGFFFAAFALAKTERIY